MNGYVSNDLHLEIAQMLDRWQGIVNTIASIVRLPCVLINRVDNSELYIQVVNESAKNPFRLGDKISLKINTYCSNVISKKSPLTVPDAVGTCYQIDNPSFDSGMHFYFGVPLFWPNKEIFGTLCMLGPSGSKQDDACTELLFGFKNAIEYDLALIMTCTKKSLLKPSMDLGQAIEIISSKSDITSLSKPHILQSELFNLLTSQYVHWNKILQDCLNSDHSPPANIARIVDIWSNLLAIAKDAEWASYTNNDVTHSEMTDVTKTLENAAYKAALTLGIEFDLLSYLPIPLYQPGSEELWSLLGLSVTSCLLISSKGYQNTIHIALRSGSREVIIEWSILHKGENVPLTLFVDNQSLYGFAKVCARLAGINLSIPGVKQTDNNELYAQTIRLHIPTY